MFYFTLFFIFFCLFDVTEINGQLSEIHTSGEKQNCSSSTILNAYCVQVLENLLLLVVGVPDSNVSRSNNLQSLAYGKTSIKQILEDLTAIKGNGNVSIQRQAISQNSNVTMICCFLRNFQNAWVNCCTQISTFCEGVESEPCGDCFKTKHNCRNQENRI